MRTSTSLLALLALLLAGPAAGQGTVTADVDYVQATDYEDGRDLLDVYMPEGAEGVPTVVFFHGGALMGGDKGAGRVLAERLIPEGIGVVSANYRLSPRVRHPAHVQDAARATAWVVEHIAGYGGDPDRVFLSGHSAGAYLAALLALDPTHLEGVGVDPDRVRGSVLVSPFLYVEETAPERPKVVWGEDPSDWAAASVTPHIGVGKGPILLIYADGDAAWRKGQNDRFAAAMREAGSDASAVEVPGRDHRSLMTEVTAADDRVGALIVRFVEGAR